MNIAEGTVPAQNARLKPSALLAVFSMACFYMGQQSVIFQLPSEVFQVDRSAFQCNHIPFCTFYHKEQHCTVCPISMYLFLQVKFYQGIMVSSVQP